MALSYSALKRYAYCPTRYRLERILKLKPPVEEDKTAADRGNMLHDLCEQYILKQLDTLPTDLLPMKTVLDRLRDWGQCKPEMKLAVLADGSPTDYDDPEARYRGIIDTVEPYPAKRRVILGDWKSGKVRDYTPQLRFYAMMVFAHFLDIDTVETCIRYIDLGKVEKGPTLSRSDFPQLWAAAELQRTIIEKDRVFSPNPSGNCKYCPWSKKNGGPCKW